MSKGTMKRKAKKNVREDGDPFTKVAALVMTILEGYGTHEQVEELRRLSLEHHATCALGSVSACTCGHNEARSFLALLDGTMRSDSLVPKKVQKLFGAGNLEIICR